MITTNILQSKLKQSENKIVVLDPDVFGMKYLWDIPFQCIDKEIVEQVCSFIVLLYTNLGSSIKASPSDFIRSFFKFSLNKAEDAADKKYGTMLAIKLIKSYLSESEGEKYVKIDKATYKVEPVVNISIEVKRHNEKNKLINLVICKTLTVFHLKNAISSELKVPLSQFKVKSKAINTMLVSKEQNKLIIKDIIGTTETPFLVEILKSKKTQYNLSSTISNDKDMRERLFRLMKQDDDFAEEIWKLMKGFPENLLEYKTPSNEVDDAIIDTWDKLMSPKKDLHALLWNIHAMKRLILEKQFSEALTENYMQTCLKKGVFIYLTSKYKKLVLRLKKKSYTNARLVKYILKILCTAISPYYY